MIKLEKGEAPEELTEELATAKTQEYKDSVAAGKPVSVWNIPWLKEALMDLSNGKCAYCEVSLKKESTYMEVEHFEDKAHNLDKVMKWENLLPSCKHCNSHKNDHDVIAEPIVNPFIDQPKNHLYIKNYMPCHRDVKGRMTIEVLGLKDYERIINRWFVIGKQSESNIDKVVMRDENFREKQITRRRTLLNTELRNLLIECQPDKEYSALCSTILLENDQLQDIRKDLQNKNLWTDDLEELWKKCESISLSK